MCNLSHISWRWPGIYLFLYHEEIPTRKNFNPRNNHEEKFRTHEIPTRKIFGRLKCPREENTKLIDKSMIVRDPRDPR